MPDPTAILEIISSLSSTLALDEILAECTEKIAQVSGADGCTISRWDHPADSLTVLANYVASTVAQPIDNVGAVYPLADFATSHQVLRRQTPLVLTVNDFTADEDEAEKNLLKALHWHSVLLVPMLHKGQALGLLALYSNRQAWVNFSAADLALGQALANQAAIAIENARLFQEAEEGRLHAEAMQVISRALSSELDSQRIMRNVANFAYRLVNPAQFVGVVWLETDTFRPAAVAGPEPTPLPSESLVALAGEAVLGRAVKGPAIVPDLRQEPQAEAALAHGWRSLVAVPLLSYDRLWGVLVAYGDRPHAFTPNDVAILMSLASQAAVALQNARLVEALEQQRAALHQVSLRLVNAQEEERRRISRELHDELGQALTALKINLEVGRHALPADAPAKLKESLTEAARLAVQTMESARNLSLELHPAILDDLGLIAALRWEIDRYEQRTGQTVQLKATLPEIKLLPELEITIYRVIIEALTNIARHAQASQISIALQQQAGQILVIIQDDGLGFEAEQWQQSPSRRQSLGLVSMRERAELLGGGLVVRSQPGQGTQVRMHLPC